VFKYFVTLTNRNCIHEVITTRLIRECLLAFGPERSNIPCAVRKYKD